MSEHTSAADPLVACITGARVQTHELFGEVAEYAMFAEEEAAISGAVDVRRRQYSAARWAARCAARQMGLGQFPILNDAAGAPRWPTGVVGALTHCDGYTAAAVASATDVEALGIDAEPDASTPEGVLELISTPRERRWLATDRRRFAVAALDRALFSAKESVFKAWSVHNRGWLDFTDVEVRFITDASFVASFMTDVPPVTPTSPRLIFGRWVARCGIVVTGITVESHRGRGSVT